MPGRALNLAGRCGDPGRRQLGRVATGAHEGNNHQEWPSGRGGSTPGMLRDVQATPAGELELVFAADLTLGAITWWLEHDRSLPAREMAEAVVRFATQGYFGALGLDVLLPET